MMGCAWCEVDKDDAKQVIVGESTYDGEWCCSIECLNKLDAYGCRKEEVQGDGNN